MISQNKNKDCISAKKAEFIQKTTGISTETSGFQTELDLWVSQHPRQWWSTIWNTCCIKGDPGTIQVDQDPQPASPAEIFANARLNIAENLLDFGPWVDLVMTAWAEDGPRQILSRGRLKEIAGRFATGFVGLGLVPGDMVVLNLPNTPEKAAAFFGACWAGLIPIFDPPETAIGKIADRPWISLKPKLILSPDGYRRNGQWIDCADVLREAGRGLGFDMQVLAIPCAGSKSNVQNLPGIFAWEKFARMGRGGGCGYQYVSFDHPMALLPDGKAGYLEIKTGDWVLSALEKWVLDIESRPEQTSFVANVEDQADWLFALAALATGGDIVIYDGHANAMNGQVIWRILEREQVFIVGIHLNQIAELQRAKIFPSDHHQLSEVKCAFLTKEASVKDTRFLQEHCFAEAVIKKI